MAVIKATDTLSSVAGYVNACVTTALSSFSVDYWPPHQVDIGTGYTSAPMARGNASGQARVIAAASSLGYVDDFYNRVQIHPATIALGNLVSSQTRTVTVWNAWLDRSSTVTDVLSDSDSAIVVSGQGNPPLVMPPLQELTWQLSIGVAGAATLDTTVQWLFAGDPPLGVRITGQRVTAWTYAPNWDSGVTERLEWLTLVERGTNGNETSTPLRETPRRSWEFVPVVEGVNRQRMESMLYDASARTWAVPVWAEINVLPAALALGALSIPVATAGLDFHKGGLAILMTDARTVETVEIDSLTAGAINLVRATLNAWDAGTKLYPARTARLDEYPTLNRYTTRLVDTTVRFVSVDANDYTAAMPAARYLGTPVLEDRPEWSDNPTMQYGRDVELIDGNTGGVLVDDISGKPWPVQSHRWQVYGRVAHDTLRQLLYALAGKVGRVWLPTWQDDLYLAADAAGNTMDVTNSGYTAYLYGQNGRRDIRVQLADGSVLYRRITASAEIDIDTERLQLDSAWPSTIAKGNVVSISFMALCRLDTDAVEIQHWTDSVGTAACAVTFAQVTGNG
jgi:hypothetical protein